MNEGSKLYAFLRELFVLGTIEKVDVKDNYIYWDYDDRQVIVVTAKGIESSSDVIITKELLDEFGISKDKLYRNAYNNGSYPTNPPYDKSINVFLSYGMHGRTEEEQKEARKRLIERINKYFNEDPAIHILLVDNHKCVGSEKDGRLYYLGEAIKKMDKCDAIIFDDDWKEHKGCQIERQVAATYGLMIIE